MRMRLTNSNLGGSGKREHRFAEAKNRGCQAALPPRGGPMLEQVCAENNFLLFDYGVHIADKPDF